MMALSLLFWVFGSSAFLYIGYRFKGIATLLCFVSIIFTPFFTKTVGWDWFDYVKRYSVIIPLAFYSLTQFYREKEAWKDLNTRQSKRFSILVSAFSFLVLGGALAPEFVSSQVVIMPFILLGNIFEASMKSLFNGETINAFIGTILVLTVPNFWGRWYFDKSSILGFGNYPDWCVVYTLWNAHFIQLQTGILIEKSYLPLMIILVVNALVCLVYKSWHIWIFARAFSLGFVLIITGFFADLIPDFYWVMSQKWLNICSYIIFFPAVYLFYRTIKEKRSCLIKL